MRGDRDKVRTFCRLVANYADQRTRKRREKHAQTDSEKGRGGDEEEEDFHLVTQFVGSQAHQEKTRGWKDSE